MRQKKKDPNKVDKKFLWPHGITPPTKNVRRRRFRKTLKKKYVEAPEIEKEVKRLLRVDNEAVNVKWEVICEDEDQTKPTKISSSGIVKGKRDNIDGNTSQSVDVGKFVCADDEIKFKSGKTFVQWIIDNKSEMSKINLFYRFHML